MKNKIYKIFLFLFLFLSINCLLFVKNNNINTNDYTKIKKNINDYTNYEKSNVDVVLLSEWEYAFISVLTSADAICEWSFSEIPSKANITVLVMTPTSFTLFEDDFNSSYIYTELSDGSHMSDSGTWIAPYEETWYFVFWNNNDMTTHITYEVTTSNFFELTITRPTASSIWLTGANQSIRWAFTDKEIRLDLYHRVVQINHHTMTIVQNISGEIGFYNWIIPSDLSSSSTYLIRISEVGGNNYSFSGMFGLVNLDQIENLSTTQVSSKAEITTYTGSYPLVTIPRMSTKNDEFTNQNIEFLIFTIILITCFRIILRRRK
ncbi:MAG: Ser-Thr-rich GPI-anchored membrane family protein [Candidatus Hodarchaeales archaeon]|jgi:hypothetical protein